MRRRRPLATVVALAALVVAGSASSASGQRARPHRAAPAAVPAYGTIVDLGTIGGTESSGGPVALTGRVVGDAITADGSRHAFLADVFAQDLGTVRPAPANSAALAISPDGNTIVGWSEPAVPVDDPTYHETYYAARWRAPGFAPEDLGAISDAGGRTCGPGRQFTRFGYAKAVNNAGTVVGVASSGIEQCQDVATPDSQFPWTGHAFRFLAGAALPDPVLGTTGMEDLGTFDSLETDTQPTVGFSAALGINSAGDIVGSAGSAALGGWGITPGASTLIQHAFLLPAGLGKGHMVDLGEPAGGTGANDYSEAAAINVVQEIALNARDDSGNLHAYRYDYATGTPTELGSLGLWARGNAINANGDIVGTSADASGVQSAFLARGSGFIDLNTLLPANTPWHLDSARGINALGDISGSGTINGHRHAYLLHGCVLPVAALDDANVINAMEDVDADGIPDCWERNGVQVFAADGTTPTRVLTLAGAKVGHKDLYVEVDSMVGHAPAPGAFPPVVAAFARAPVPNLDGSTGIALHVEPDETNIPNVATLDMGTGATTLYTIKDQAGTPCAGAFGTPAQRAAPNCSTVLKAKAAVYRWALFANAQPGTTSSGLGEMPGNDFMVTLGAWSASDLDQGSGCTIGCNHLRTRALAEGATFMHELGHTLGLGHGGPVGTAGANVNCKPNYLSIMNYNYQFAWPGANPTRPFDYSRTDSPTLDETALNETAGVGGPGTLRVVWAGRNGRTLSAPANTPLDWNDDGLFSAPAAPVAADIKAVQSVGCVAGALETLSTANDWNAIVYRFRGLPQAASGASPTVDPTTEPTAADVTRTAATGPLRPTLTIPAQTVKAAVKRGLAIAIGSGEHATATITVTAPANQVGRKGTAAVVLFAHALTIATGVRATPRLALTRAITRKIPARRRVTVTLTVVYRYAGATITITRTTTLR